MSAIKVLNNGPPMLGVAYFSHTKGVGWSETYYVNSTTHDDALTKLGTLIDARLAMLTNKYQCLYGRVSIIGYRGDSKVLAFTGQKPGTYVPTAPDGNDPSVCLLVRFNSAEGGTRMMRTLAGIPEECVTDGVYTPTAGFGTAWTAWGNAIQTNCSMVTKPIDGAGNWTVRSINGYASRYVRWKKLGRPFGALRGRSAIR